MKDGFCRRDFIKSFTALGGLVAVSKLPVLADNPQLQSTYDAIQVYNETYGVSQK